MKSNPAVVMNRKAHYDYVLGEQLEVGMVLSGPEVRVMRDHHAQIKGAYVVVRRDELWLIGMTLGAEMARDVKLLATKRQIAGLLRQKVQGFTIVPVKLLPLKRHIKLVIAVGRGKKAYDKRQTIKERDLSREQN
ncbi:SsrA-binding protein [Candidatus Saccharibacteria bacterium]|nr:SsrA-binding protein [Candidatus Saccharibacteria bacterium]